jgi:diketogulonate reductase-like aldo/keto reductase
MTAHLRTNDKMPLVGLGTWKIPKDKTANTVKTSLAIGYRLLDCACDYGNEKEVGLGIKQAIDEGIVKRDQIWVTSKLWNTYHGKNHVKAACKRSLADLGLEYLDLYLIHFPISLKYVDFETRYPPEWDYDPSKPGCVFEDVPTAETWAAMEELVVEGLVRNIGISNFNCQHIMDLMKYAKIKPAVNQIEYHPYLQQPQLVEYCHRKEVNIALTAYSSFGGHSYIPLGNKLAASTPSLLEHKVIESIAKKHGKTIPQVLLRFATQQGIAVIPKSVDSNRLKENFHLEFNLDPSDIEEIRKLDQKLRFNDPADFANYPIYG